VVGDMFLNAKIVHLTEIHGHVFAVYGEGTIKGYLRK
jgi:hypothetical protein